MGTSLVSLDARVTTLEGGGGGGGAPSNATFVVMSLDGTLTAERVLTAGTGISITDGGAGGNVTIAATSSGPATELDTTGAAVDVSGAAPPVAGYVLTATSATAATWQAPSSGLTQSQVLARGLGA